VRKLQLATVGWEQRGDEEEEQKLKELLVCILEYWFASSKCGGLHTGTGTAIAYIEKLKNCPKRKTTMRLFLFFL
jgi:hypothetical protein